MPYPQFVKIRGKKVRIKTDYNTALKCFKVINDNTIGDYERALAVVYIMYGYIPDEDLINDYLVMAQKFLQCGESIDEQEAKEADMDFNYDRKYINASFMSDYHIDLTQYPNMHFWQFCELITGLTDKCILSRVRQIRTCDPNDYAEKDRHEIYKAKEALALPVNYSKEEQAKIDEFEALFGGIGGE